MVPLTAAISEDDGTSILSLLVGGSNEDTA